MGRPKGSKNKDKADFKSWLEVQCAKHGKDPFEFMAYSMNNRRIDYVTRVQCAKELAQYMQPKLRAVEVSGNPDKPLYPDAEARQKRIAELLAKGEIEPLALVDPE